jgi:hypothetical protein
VKVNMEGGDIAIGDRITLSSEAGIGTKATTTTRVLGTALEDADSAGVISVFVEPSFYYAPQIQTQLTSLFAPIEANQADTLWSRLTNLASNFVDGVLNVTGIKTDELCVGEVCVDEATFLEIVEQAGGSTVAPSGGGGEPDPDPDPVPEPEPEPPPPPPEPDPVAEPVPEPAI